MSRETSNIPILRKLPNRLLRETLDRLNRGQKDRTITRWLMGCHRGELHHEGEYNIGQYIRELRAWTQQFHPTLAPEELQLRLSAPIMGLFSPLSPAWEEQFQRLLEKTNAGHLAGRPLLNLVALARLERLHKLLQNRGSDAQITAAFRDLERSAELFCKSGLVGLALEREIKIDTSDPVVAERVRQAEAAVQQMSAPDRMLLRQAFKFTREILKNAKLEAEEQGKEPPG